MGNILVTGAAGFIGFHVARALLERGEIVTGVDDLDDYYDVNLKRARLEQLEAYEGFGFQRLDIAEPEGLTRLLGEKRVDRVIHLAAQAGVRYSLQNPRLYVRSNVAGFLEVLEACREHSVRHLVYASSSSVYGGSEKMPFSTDDSVDRPVSLYAATKKSDELMAHVYGHLYGLPTTGLRFFTVYGPWGRPDMAAFLFTKAILEKRPIKVFNNGELKRDFTFVDDIVKGLLEVLARPPSTVPPYALYNIGNSQPVELLKFIEVLEHELGVKAIKEFLPMQAGDVPATFADTEPLQALTGFRPSTPLEQGLREFVAWYRSYYGV